MANIGGRLTLLANVGARLALTVTLLVCASCEDTMAPELKDIDAALELPEARAFVTAEAAFQATVANGPSEAFATRAGGLRRAAEALRRKLEPSSAPDVRQLTGELEAVAVLVGPGLAPESGQDPEIRRQIGSAVRRRLFSLREFRHVLEP